MQEVVDKQWWIGFQGGHNYALENDTLTIYIYDPPEYSFKETIAVLDIHAKLGHELNHLLAGAFYFKGFDPSGAFVWGQPVGNDTGHDPGRGLFYEAWVIYGHVIVDPFCDMEFKLEHHAKGKFFIEDTYKIICNNNTIPEKWLDRWEDLKGKIQEMTEFRKTMTIDPWKPKGFSKVKLGLLDTSLINDLNLKKLS